MIFPIPAGFLQIHLSPGRILGQGQSYGLIVEPSRGPPVHGQARRNQTVYGRSEDVHVRFSFRHRCVGFGFAARPGRGIQITAADSSKMTVLILMVFAKGGCTGVVKDRWEGNDAGAYLASGMENRNPSSPPEPPSFAAQVDRRGGGELAPGSVTVSSPETPACSQTRSRVPAPSGFGPKAVTRTPWRETLRPLCSAGSLPPCAGGGDGEQRVAGFEGRRGHDGVGGRLGVEGPEPDARTPGAGIPVAEIRVPLVVVEVQIDDGLLRA